MSVSNNERRDHCISVSQLNEYIKTLIDGNAFLSNVCVKGEISNFTNHRTGHFYFSIKDESSLIRAVMFRSAASRIKFIPENGMKIIARGSVSLFVRDGQYQLYVSSMEPEGVGSLYLAFEQLKQKLEKEGLFDKARKKAIPVMPLRIGVITSPTGAAVRDIINIISRRFPIAKIVLYPAQVQGEGAHEQLIDGIKYFNSKSSADVIILGRGGGSIEDLWEFNNEKLAYVISESNIPIISAVGHETDFTICDFVSDMRAPTPSAAAELAVPDTSELLATLSNVRSRMSTLLLQKIFYEKEKIKLFSERKIFTDPEYYLQEKKLITAFLYDKLSRSINLKINDYSYSLQKISGKLDAMSPLATLSRGYSINYNLTADKSVTSICDVSKDDNLKMRLSDGSILVNVIDVEPHKNK